MSVLFAPVSGRWVGARGARVPLAIAGVGIATAGVMLTGLDNHTPIAYILVTYAIFGFGFGWLNAPITNTAVSGMPREQAGVAAAIASTSRQVGQSLGVAVIGAAVASVMASMFGSSFAAASHVGWWIIAGCGLVVLVLGVVSTSAWARDTAAEVVARTAEPEPAPVG
jgi:MFS family permease